MNLPVLILSLLAFAAIYPLYFWISVDGPLKDKFRKFHIALPNVIGGIVLISVWLTDIPLSLKILVTLWKAILLSVSRYSWKQKYPDPKLMTLPCLLGIYTLIRLQAYFIEPGWLMIFIGAGTGFTAVFVSVWYQIRHVSLK